MMRQTITQYIHGTDIPYPDIINRAKRGGWTATRDTQDAETRTVCLEKAGNNPVIICYYLDATTCGKLACFTTA